METTHIMKKRQIIFKHPRQILLLLVEDDICAVMVIFIHIFLDQGMCPVEPDQPVLSRSNINGLLWGDAKLRKDYRVDVLAEATRCDLTSMMILSRNL